MEVLLDKTLTNEILSDIDKYISGLSTYILIKMWRVLLCLEENSYENLKVPPHGILSITISMLIVYNT
jgi:hypothetical protein